MQTRNPSYLNRVIALRDQHWAAVREMLPYIQGFVESKRTDGAVLTTATDEAVIIVLATAVSADLVLIAIGNKAAEPGLVCFCNDMARIHAISHGIYTDDDLPFIRYIAERVVDVFRMK